jgi:hypothetical protein
MFVPLQDFNFRKGSYHDGIPNNQLSFPGSYCILAEQMRWKDIYHHQLLSYQVNSKDLRMDHFYVAL